MVRHTTPKSEAHAENAEKARHTFSKSEAHHFFTSNLSLLPSSRFKKHPDKASKATSDPLEEEKSVPAQPSDTMSTATAMDTASEAYGEVSAEDVHKFAAFISSYILEQLMDEDPFELSSAD